MRTLLACILAVLVISQTCSAFKDCTPPSDDPTSPYYFQSYPPDCNGGMCQRLAIDTVPSNWTHCATCPLGRSGYNCEISSGIIFNNGIGCPVGGCNSGRCLQLPNGTMGCVDCAPGTRGYRCDINATEFFANDFLPSRRLVLTRGVVYGPYVCGITAPCDFVPELGIYKPRGTCGVNYTLNMFDSQRSACGPTNGDVCAVGPFYNNRAWQVRVPNVPEPVNCAKMNVYMPWSTFRPSYFLQRYGIVATGPGPLCDSIPGKCANGTCVRQTGDYHIVNVNGFLRTVPAQDICCPLGRYGNLCEKAIGCLAGGCLHGGQCLTQDKRGVAIPSADTRCFGCTPGTNTTVGWTGAMCEIPVTPTFIPVSSTTPGRRLLQSGGGDSLVRNPQGFTSPGQGVIYKEPARVCDCGVRWEEPTTNFTGVRWMLMGNYPSNTPNTALLSVVQYGTTTGVNPYYWQTVKTLEQAKYLCSRDWSCGGVVYDSVALRFASFSRFERVWNGVSRVAGPAAQGLPGSALKYSLTRLADPLKCNSTVLDPVFYCNTYPLQCQALREQGGVGNIRVSSNTSIDMIASLHFDAFGHLVRNKPNANCDLTVEYAEDEQGCQNLLRYPKAFYALAPGEQLTAEICGNSSRIEEARVAFGPLLPGVTGTNITNGMDAVCMCYPPFRPANKTSYQDCSYDLCGIDDNRGQVNATYANELDHASHFDHTNVAACACNYPWGTDPASCKNGIACNWCSATACQNGGTANSQNYSMACQCNRLFTGDRCEVNLCNPTNSYPFNYTQWVKTGVSAEQVVCSCKSGWDGIYCDHKACVHGQFNYALNACDCAPGYQSSSEGTCDELICDAERGFWRPSYIDSVLYPMHATNNYTVGNQTVMNTTTWFEYRTETIPAHCVCQLPWSGPRCLDHVCDSDNVVLSIPGWAGERPFGQPQPVKDNNAKWECGCNWPYKPRDLGLDKAYDCADHDCNFGFPNANASLVKSAVDSCTCTTDTTTGVFTDSKKCTNKTHDECPNACRVGMCGLLPEEILAYGSVQLGDTPDCCRCPASLGYNIKGECQAFCAVYQPCLTTSLSGFMPNPNYNASLEYNWEDPNVTRVAVGNDKYICACRAGCFNTDDRLNDCSRCNYVVRENGTKGDPYDYGYNPPNSLEGSGSSFGSSILGNKPLLYSLIAAGVIVFVAVIVAIIQAATAATAAGVAMTDKTKLLPPATAGRLNIRRSKYAFKRMTTTAVIFILMGTMSVEGYLVKPDVPDIVGYQWNAPVASGTGIYRNGIYSTPINNWLEPYQVSCENGWNTKWSTNWDADIGNPRRMTGGYQRGIDCFLQVNNQLTRGPVGPSSPLSLSPSAVEWRDSFSDDSSSGVNPVPDSRAFYVGNFPVSRINSFISDLVDYDSAVNRYMIRWVVSMCDTQPVTNPYTLGPFPVQCQSGGTCVSTIAHNPDSSFLGTSSFRSSQECPAASVFYTGNVYTTTVGTPIVMSIAPLVRGCECPNGFHGQLCEKTCPSSSNTIDHPLCSGRGICKSGSIAGVSKRDTKSGSLAHCVCPDPIGCTCRVGYTGQWCEKAVFLARAETPVKTSAGTPVLLEDFSECCPYDSPSCSPVQSVLTKRICTTSTMCAGSAPTACDPISLSSSSTCMNEFPHQWQHSVHTAAPLSCGEGDNSPAPGWTPTKIFNAGHGMCDVPYESKFISYSDPSNPTVLPTGRAFCWCNNHISTPYNPNRRHGWFGPKCATRTCTSVPRALTVDSQGNRITKALASVAQCSGNVPPYYRTTSANYEDAKDSPCEDLTIASGSLYTRVNSPGYCKQCLDGWGLHAAVSPDVMRTQGYTEPITGTGTNNGLCSVPTLHSNSGAVCGGYGDPNGLRFFYIQGATSSINAVYSYSFSGCDCSAGGGVYKPTANGGICQRSCAGNTDDPLITTKFSTIPTFDDNGIFNGTTGVTVDYVTNIGTRCGGYKQGICRPIMADEWGGGFNSACMCNPGYNGPRCDKVESMWYKKTVCGPEGQAVLQIPPSPTSLSWDEYWFNRYIVPMKYAESLNSMTDYSAYKCECKLDAKNRGWEPNKNGICAQSCNSVELKNGTGALCSGHGRCIDDPRVGETVGKVCSCDLGWDGINCATPNLRDQAGQVCGGPMDGEGEDGVTPRGVIIYRDTNTNMTQKCQCKAPYVEKVMSGTTYGLCWKDCPRNCTDINHGACILNPVTGNDNICDCVDGAFTGADCSQKLVAVFVTQSGTELSCTGHGVPSPTNEGYCICDEDYVGVACEIYQPNRQCGTGQTFMDTESVGIIVR